MSGPRYVPPMQTMDPAAPAPDGARSSPAAARNAGFILEVLKAVLPARGEVLEIASGTGQHAAAFAAGLPGLTWRPTDISDEALESIAAWRVGGPANLAAPRRLDVTQPGDWPDAPVDAVVAINLIHISPWTAGQALLRGAARTLPRGGLLFLYGPFREAGRPLAESNAAFDESLKARDPAWGLREVEAVAAEAAGHGLALTLRKTMPANNLSLLFRRT
jgi:SAM-dependent methyltransferase